MTINLIWAIVALTLMASALSLSAYEIWIHLRRQPANDTDAPRIDPRLRNGMTIAAFLLIVALGVLIAAPR